MRAFLYEYITGGGMFGEDEPPQGSLLREGKAMIEAVAADFGAVDDCRVTILRDARLPMLDAPCAEMVRVDSAASERESFMKAAKESDATLIVAPEIGGALLSRVRLATGAGARLLSPPAEFVALASDKHELCEHFASCGIAAPRGVLWTAGAPAPDLRYPVVVKPIDGAGSWNVRRVSGPSDLNDVCFEGHSWRVEEWRGGVAASVGVICSEGRFNPLPPTLQLLSDDGRFAYLGSEFTLSPEQQIRAINLAERALTTLPPARGYVGVDLVLGRDEKDDVVIEVNPRLTTSYIEVRRRVEENLAVKMLGLREEGTITARSP